MAKKIIYMLLILNLLLSACGCTAVFSNTYQTEQDFQGNEKIDLDSNIQMVKNYNELRRLIFNMVNNHIESTELVFSGYTGNVVSDIASVCNAVKTENSFGAYCVDYISYDLRQIVSSYEAKINISYLYTSEELQILQTVSNLENFGQLLVEALEQEQPKLLVRVNNGTVDLDTVNELIMHQVRNHPMAISYVPKFSVRVFDGNSSQKIYDVSIAYDSALDNTDRLKDMEDAVVKLGTPFNDEVPQMYALHIAEGLREYCQLDMNAGDTAYHALVNGSADSQGIACAFKALCDQYGLSCMVVTGRMDKQAHYWNIIQIDDAYYHMDISLFFVAEGEQSLFMSDSEKQVNCWWDQSAYPACEGELSYGLLNLSE